MLTEMAAFFRGRSDEAKAMVCDWHGRIMAMVAKEVDAGNPLPVVIWVGAIVNGARAWLAEMGMITAPVAEPLLITLPFMRVYIASGNAGERQLQYLSLEGAVHPSAHLQARSSVTTDLASRSSVVSVFS